ncbi:uncharacterized protein LOC9635950 isoform X1 [Selaginella moellendorffii]|nr:uncharacterized protein LOC9635950 isoform X1 [Selaginella moellendorffii]|eukprot:XP_002982347.2 uncharacterized protein LOC9635950 isoform X1 [Selaginella moellendorffii]
MLAVKNEEVEIPLEKDERIMYTLVRIDENGMMFPTTDEDLMEVESLIQGESSEDDHTDQDDEKDDARPMEEDLEDVKLRLLKQLEVVDTMLLKVKTEEDQRALESSGYNGAKFTYKRRRRPNPKYFNINAFDCTGELPPSDQMVAQVKVEPLKLMEEEPICSSSTPGTITPQFDASYTPPKLFLDNLSIRALQDTYRNTFGRVTSAKDKHWLKQKITKGLNSMNESSAQAVVVAAQAQENLLKERLEGETSAEQPFGMEKQEEDVKPVVLGTSPTISLDASTTTVVSRPSDGQSHLNEVQSLEGKRHRKPNRRYVEEEADDVASFVPSMSSPEDQQQQLQVDFWKSDGEDGDPDDPDVDGDDLDESFDLNGRELDSMSPEGSFGARSRNRMGELKAERRAAQLVKMARNARAAKRDANTSIRKIKFKLPSAPGQDNDENYEPNDESADQVSCMLPSVSDELQPSDTEDQDTDRKSGSRRKHHRPWTLREVMALVDGVSRCGTGKWADIKRLAFSAIAYRTPVDLKDKWRNLLRASRVHSHSSRQVSEQGEKRRKHFSVSIPAHILARVRELAAQPGQTLKLPVIRSTRSRRMVQRKI